MLKKSQNQINKKLIIIFIFLLGCFFNLNYSFAREFQSKSKATPKQQSLTTTNDLGQISPNPQTGFNPRQYMNIKSDLDGFKLPTNRSIGPGESRLLEEQHRLEKNMAMKSSAKQTTNPSNSQDSKANSFQNRQTGRDKQRERMEEATSQMTEKLQTQNEEKKAREADLKMHASGIKREADKMQKLNESQQTKANSSMYTNGDEEFAKADSSFSIDSEVSQQMQDPLSMNDFVKQTTMDRAKQSENEDLSMNDLSQNEETLQETEFQTQTNTQKTKKQIKQIVDIQDTYDQGLQKAISNFTLLTKDVKPIKTLTKKLKKSIANLKTENESIDLKQINIEKIVAENKDLFEQQINEVKEISSVGIKTLQDEIRPTITDILNDLSSIQNTAGNIISVVDELQQKTQQQDQKFNGQDQKITKIETEVAQQLQQHTQQQDQKITEVETNIKKQGQQQDQKIIQFKTEVQKGIQQEVQQQVQQQNQQITEVETNIKKQVQQQNQQITKIETEVAQQLQQHTQQQDQKLNGQDQKILQVADQVQQQNQQITEVKAEVQQVRQEVKAEVQQVRQEVKAEVQQQTKDEVRECIEGVNLILSNNKQLIDGLTSKIEGTTEVLNSVQNIQASLSNEMNTIAKDAVSEYFRTSSSITAQGSIIKPNELEDIKTEVQKQVQQQAQEQDQKIIQFKTEVQKGIQQEVQQQVQQQNQQITKIETEVVQQLQQHTQQQDQKLNGQDQKILQVADQVQQQNQQITEVKAEVQQQVKAEVQNQLQKQDKKITEAETNIQKQVQEQDQKIIQFKTEVQKGIQQEVQQQVQEQDQKITKIETEVVQQLQQHTQQQDQKLNEQDQKILQVADQVQQQDQKITLAETEIKQQKKDLEKLKTNLQNQSAQLTKKQKDEVAQLEAEIQKLKQETAQQVQQFLNNTNYIKPLYQLEEVDILFINDINKLYYVYSQNLHNLFSLFINSDSSKGRFSINTPLNNLDLDLAFGYMTNSFTSLDQQSITLAQNKSQTNKYNSILNSRYAYLTARYYFSNLITGVGILGYQNIDFLFDKQDNIRNTNNLFLHAGYLQFKLDSILDRHLKIFNGAIVKVGYLGFSNLNDVLNLSYPNKQQNTNLYNTNFKLHDNANFKNYMIFIYGKQSFKISNLLTIEPTFTFSSTNINFNNAFIYNSKDSTQYIQMDNSNNFFTNLSCKLGVDFKFLLYKIFYLSKVEAIISVRMDMPLLNNTKFKYKTNEIDLNSFDLHKIKYSLFKSDISTGLLFTFFDTVELRVNGNIGVNNSLFNYSAKANINVSF